MNTINYLKITLATSTAAKPMGLLLPDVEGMSLEIASDGAARITLPLEFFLAPVTAAPVRQFIPAGQPQNRTGKPSSDEIEEIVRQFNSGLGVAEIAVRIRRRKEMVEKIIGDLAAPPPVAAAAAPAGSSESAKASAVNSSIRG